MNLASAVMQGFTRRTPGPWSYLGLQCSGLGKSSWQGDAFRRWVWVWCVCVCVRMFGHLFCLPGDELVFLLDCSLASAAVELFERNS